jgi:hypothetical protein
MLADAATRSLRCALNYQSEGAEHACEWGIVIHTTTKEMTMRMIIVAAIALVFAASGALAQNPPANDGPNNKAINSKSEDNPGAPVAGANSFTEGQAQSRIEAKGYTNVGSLKKDTKGVWRGTAMRDGKSVDVSLDFEGNIVAR